MSNKTSIFSVGQQSREMLLNKFVTKTRKASNGCVEWTARMGEDGYGLVGLPRTGKTIRATRASYELFVGDIPQGHLVLHRCDNRKCVSPSHLFTGTHKDNMRDMSDKGRQWQQKITSEMAKEIREKFSNGESIRSIAKRYSVYYGTIWFVVNMKTHV